MKMSILLLHVLIMLLMLFTGCTPASTPTPASVPATHTASPFPATWTLSPNPPTDIPSPIPNTLTPTSTSTITLTPTPTSLPGLLVLPVDTLGNSIPWLPVDDTARPGVNFIGFNMNNPPFNSPIIREAFALSIDRDLLVEMAISYKSQNTAHASTLTPPEIMGRDLYGEVGIMFNPQKAKEMLAQAGYADSPSFPQVELIVGVYGDIAPGARYNMATAMAEMWKEHLGIDVSVLALSRAAWRDRLSNNPPEMFWVGWIADYNDPDNFLGEIFHSGSPANFGNFSNPEFDRLVDLASRSKEPAERQALYIQAERLLCETEVAILPLFFVTQNILR